MTKLTYQSIVCFLKRVDCYINAKVTKIHQVNLLRVSISLIDPHPSRIGQVRMKLLSAGYHIYLERPPMDSYTFIVERGN